MMLLWRNIISAVSLILLFVSCGGKEPGDYAEEWCELNSEIELSENESEKKILLHEMEMLENEIKRVYESDPDKIKLIKKITRECD